MNDLENRDGLKEVELSDDLLREYLKNLALRSTMLHLEVLKLGKKDGFPLCIDLPVKYDEKEEQWIIPVESQTDTYRVCLDLVGVGLLRIVGDKRVGLIWKFELDKGMLYDVFVKYLEGTL